MKSILISLIFIFRSLFTIAQSTDTITFQSNAFQQERTIYVQKPEFFKYQSEKVALPVIYLLDGQHEWFINPLLSTIKYLQYTHEIPQALVVIIPLNDRNKECTFPAIDAAPTALHQFITKEVDQQIQPYKPNSYKLIIGHSFSASFALYSYHKQPTYYAGVVAHTPLDQLESIIKAISSNKAVNLRQLAVSVGGIAKDKDYYHRRTYDKMKTKYPVFFSAIHLFEANHSSHNAVPITTTPQLLSKIFETFSSRYSTIAAVNEEYKLISKPTAIKDELAAIEKASVIDRHQYPPELADINGLASRYLASGYNDYALAVYELGTRYFPKYFEFHLSLYQLYLSIDKEKAKYHLTTAAGLLQQLETTLPEQRIILEEIEEERKKNGW